MLVISVTFCSSTKFFLLLIQFLTYIFSHEDLLCSRHILDYHRQLSTSSKFSQHFPFSLFQLQVSFCIYLTIFYYFSLFYYILQQKYYQVISSWPREYHPSRSHTHKYHNSSLWAVVGFKPDILY